MATSYGGTPPGITGTHYGGSSLGVLGADVPAAGADGPGYLYAALSLPADAATAVRGPITRWPSGTLTVYEDSSFAYTGATDFALYALYVDGVASTVDVGHGPGIGRFDLLVGSTSELTGAVQFDAAAAAGTMTGGTPSGLSGGPTLDDVLAAGAMAQEGASGISGAVQLDEVAPAGSFSSSTGGTADPAAVAEAVLAYEIEPGVSVLNALRILLAGVSGKTSGIGTSTERYFSADGSKPRITATFDADSNRTSVAVDGT